MMKKLEKIILVQFFVCDAEEIDINGHTAFLGSNGAGKTTLLDAIQIVMLGADKRYLRFNAKKTTKEDNRSIRDYCLGYFKSAGDGSADASDGGKQIVRCKRDSAHSYITLVFRDEQTNTPISVGVSLTAHHSEPSHQVKGLFVANGLELTLHDHVEQAGPGGDLLRPFPWKEFEAHLRNKASAAHAVVEITNQAEKHVRAMLYALQPKGINIDVAEYQKAFKKSIHLSDIENVSDFVRDFLIDEERIDKKKAMAQIEEFRHLQGLIEDLKQQIDDLTRLQRQYEAVGKSERRLATISSLIATYRVEEAGVRCDAAREGLEESSADLSIKDEQIAELSLEIESLDADLQVLRRTLASDQSLRSLAEHKELLNSLKGHSQQVTRTVSAGINQLRTALDGLSQNLHLPTERKSAEQLISSLQAAESKVAQDGGSALSQALPQAINSLPHLQAALSQQVREADRAAQMAAEAYEEEKASIENQRRGGVALAGAPAKAMATLTAAGIEARPVCECVAVTDPEWQRAIEASLGHKRFALLVSEARLEDAIELISQQRHRLEGATVIDQRHLNLIGTSPNEEMVSSLITGDDPVAVAFLREALRGVRKVEVAEETSAHSRALTRDGLHSLDGSFTSLTMEGQLVLGMKHHPIDEPSLRAREDRALRHQLAMEKTAGTLRRVYSQVDSLVQGDISEQLRINLAELSALAGKVTNTQNLINAVDTSATDELLGQEKSLNDRLTDVRQRHTQATDARGGLRVKINQFKELFTQAEQDIAKAKALEEKLRSVPDYDPMMVDELRSRIDIDAMGKERDYGDRIIQCIEMEEKERSRGSKTKQEAFMAFNQFVDRHGFDVIEERTDWRKAFDWIDLTRTRLVESELYRYEKDADQARRVAEDSFRRDVALRLKEGIQRMEANIKDINRILDTCPPFSNNERYKFKAKIATEYSALHDFIIASDSDESTADFLQNAPDVSQQIFDMLSSGGETNATKTPLDDFRLIFNFDLHIYEGTQQITTLSKRIGTGSNGEHKTPFYVIAAAALAHAFRIDGKGRNTGTSVMLMDEAFSDMDGTNATAAAKFISQLGIQMLMAAPSEASSKFYGFTNTVYELDRFGPDLFFHQEVLTQKAHDLMRSDMPSEHPGLIDDLLASYSTDAPTRT